MGFRFPDLGEESPDCKCQSLVVPRSCGGVRIPSPIARFTPRHLGMLLEWPAIPSQNKSYVQEPEPYSFDPYPIQPVALALNPKP